MDERDRRPARPGGAPRTRESPGESPLGRGRGRRRPQRADVRRLPGQSRQIGPGAGGPAAARRRVHPGASVRGSPVRREPLRLRRRPARRDGHPRTRPERSRPRFHPGRPQLWIPYDDGTAFAQWLDHDRTLRALRDLGLPRKEIDGYVAYEDLFDRMRIRLRKGARDTWSGDSPSRDELDALLGDTYMSDVLFHASIADVIDDFVTDQRLKDALFGQGIIGTYAGPRDPGTAAVKLMHFIGELDGVGAVWGYVKGGMGMVSFAIADAAREAGAVLASGVPVAQVIPGEGVSSRRRHVRRRRGRGLQRRPQTPDDHGHRRAGRLPAAHRRMGRPQPGRQVQRRPETPPHLDGRPRRDLHGTRRGRRDHRSRRGPARLRTLPRPANRRWGSGRSTYRTA